MTTVDVNDFTDEVGIKLDDKSKYFIHFNLGSYLDKEDAYKVFCIRQESTD